MGLFLSMHRPCWQFSQRMVYQSQMKTQNQWMQSERSTWRTRTHSNVGHSPSQPSPNTMKSMLAMALLCTGFWDRWWAQALLLPWLGGFPDPSLGLWSLKIQQHDEQLSQASSSAALPWFLSPEHQRIANDLPQLCQQGSLPCFHCSASRLLPTGCSGSICCLHLWDSCHRALLGYVLILQQNLFRDVALCRITLLHRFQIYQSF